MMAPSLPVSNPISQCFLLTAQPVVPYLKDSHNLMSWTCEDHLSPSMGTDVFDKLVHPEYTEDPHRATTLDTTIQH